ncbi:WYL domain-containing protein [Pseudodesulfovibrio nedwellii]|uniref:WYL domain-containing protein n=1 Tax=Pseudodesulfovibrio nedwellii TaxID=2973072 RepID=A0ABN6S4E0_9BACT|nr:WYL domain-containing protein [Pseudodesulfovibrio nedwellii]BDQ36828.1 WYL domain-containing protein [Pseudodesulfovibrio nedwellii]
MVNKNSLDSHGTKLLRLFQKLMLEGRRHYQSDLAEYLDCSPQTVMRLIGEIEGTVGTGLEIGTENRRRYYQLKSLASRRTLGLEFEELRYLAICHDLASPHLPQQISARVEKTIFELSTLMADPDYARRNDAQQQQIGFKSKGYIDYTGHFKHIESLIDAAQKRNICLVDYKANSQKEAKNYFYAPGRIITMNGALYVRGHKVSKGLAEKERATTFAIHRIQDVTQTDKTFNFDATIDDEGSFGMSWHEPKRFRIAFDEKTADYVRERTWSEDQKIEDQEDGGLILELTTVSERELMAWVWSFGKLATLL